MNPTVQVGFWPKRVAVLVELMLSQAQIVWCGLLKSNRTQKRTPIPSPNLLPFGHSPPASSIGDPVKRKAFSIGASQNDNYY